MSNPRELHDASELEAGYTTQHRIYEICGISVATATCAWFITSLYKFQALAGQWFPLAVVAGILMSDFISGFVHWLFDTWGSLDTPVFGKLAIRTFRHHHVDEKAITRHDFIETNGHNIALTTIWSLVGIGILHFRSVVTPLDVFSCNALLSAVFFTAITSQVHKWAHEDVPPPAIAFLQRTSLLLSPHHHAVHHSAPYNRNYCITVGWLNGPLRAIRFFETLERLITAVTGAVPRADDLGEEHARTVAEETHAEAEPLAREVIVHRD
jgi:hypothetical protein